MKIEVIEEAINRLALTNSINNQEMIMIGDRKYDIEGAKAHHIDSIGVTYGFGSSAELQNEGATYIVASIKEMADILC